MTVTFALSILITSCFVMGPAASLAAQDPFDFPVDSEKLKTGEPQLFQRAYPPQGHNKKKQIAGIILINAGPDDVWEVATEWDELGRFVPDVEYYKTILVLEPAGNGRIGKSFIEGKLDVPLFNIQYTLDVMFDQSGLRQEWRLMTPEEINIYNLIGIQLKRSSSGIESIEGASWIRPADGGRKVVYIYLSTVEYSMILPEFLEEYLSRNALAGYLEGIKKRVESQGVYVKQPFSLFAP
ncbi:MAG: hypothetical protein ACOZF0_01480 [Thermodesulfobacteriota bacterium]